MRTGESVFLRADGRWEARYQKFRDENGKMKYGFVYGSTKEEAEKKRSQALSELQTELTLDFASVLPSVNPEVSVMPAVVRKQKVRNNEKIENPLTSEQVDLIDRILDKSDESVAVGFYMCLHMGISLEELTALRYGDIDCENRILRIRMGIKSSGKSKCLVPVEQRDIPMTAAVQAFVLRHDVPDKNPNCFVLTDHETELGSSYMIGAAFRKLIKNPMQLENVSANALRCTFIKSCLEANMNIESASLISGMDKTLLYRYFGKYIKAIPESILRLDTPVNPERKRLNLLILGAGSHGHNVKETAEKLGIFHEIKFLDDGIKDDEILDRCENSARYVSHFPCAFVAIGNNDIRKRYMDKLRSEGYLIPKIIHPNATVSPNAVVGDGTVILAQATVDAATVGENCIIASNALVNRGAVVGDDVHVDCGGIVIKNSQVPERTTVGSGEIYNSFSV